MPRWRSSIPIETYLRLMFLRYWYPGTVRRRANAKRDASVSGSLLPPGLKRAGPNTRRADRREGRNLTPAVQSQCATFVYMTSVGVAELRRNLSRYLRLVARGERLTVTDRNRPVAELGPPATPGGSLDRLVAEGRVPRPTRRGLPAPLQLDGDPYALSRALDHIRGER